MPIEMSFRNLLEFISLYFTMQQSFQGILGIPLLSVAPCPYLPEKQKEDENYKEYTLILDMDETLVHFVETPQVAYITLNAQGRPIFREAVRSIIHRGNARVL